MDEWMVRMDGIGWASALGLGLGLRFWIYGSGSGVMAIKLEMDIGTEPGLEAEIT